MHLDGYNIDCTYTPTTLQVVKSIVAKVFCELDLFK